MIPYSTAELIRRAEEDIAGGKHLLALGLLAEAARREPMNMYIGALVIKADQGIERVYSSTAEPSNDGSTSERRAQHAMQTLRGEFGEGIGLLSPESADPGLEGRVKLLTVVATNLYERGSVEEAIQSLMKAHLLDPASPHVEACERLLRPALEKMRKRPEAGPPLRKPVLEEEETGRGNLYAFLQKSAQLYSRSTAVCTETDPDPHHTAGESRRLEALRARQDLERKKREIIQWRQASGPPGQNTGKRVQGNGKQVPFAQPQNSPQLSAFFSKLKQGKLFG